MKEWKGWYCKSNNDKEVMEKGGERGEKGREMYPWKHEEGVMGERRRRKE